MSLARIGHASLVLYEPAFSFASTPDVAGTRAGTIAGKVEWDVAHQLSELCANGAAAIGFAGYSGVLRYIDCDDDLLRPFAGWYLLQSCDLDAPKESSVTQLVGVSISAVWCGTREPVLLRSARVLDNDFSLSAVSLAVVPYAGETGAPEAAYSPGGTRISRESDVGPVVAYLGNVAGTADSLAQVVGLALPQLPGADWIADQVDVRAYDRREARDVYGPHQFGYPSDARLDNGLIRVWCGPAGMQAHLTIQAWTGTAWANLGVLSLATSTTHQLVSCRLIRITPEEAVLGVQVATLGEVVVTLRRGERMIRLSRGRTSTGSLRLTWLGLPPWLDLDATAADGTYGNGITGSLLLEWPAQIRTGQYAVAVRWKPDDGSTTQADSGLISIRDSDDAACGQLLYLADTQTIRYEQADSVLETGPLVFDAGDDIYIAASFSTTAGMTLTVNDTTLSDPSGIDPGTTDRSYGWIYLGIASILAAGEGAAGEGPAGGAAGANGILDNLQIFDASLTATEAGVLQASTDGNDGLPAPEGRLVLHLPFDTALLPDGSSFTTGRRFESTVEGGTTRDPDSGFTKGFVVIKSGATTPAGLAITVTDQAVAAVLATTATGDDLDDYQAQFAADNRQEIRLR